MFLDFDRIINFAIKGINYIFNIQTELYEDITSPKLLDGSVFYIYIKI